MLSVFVFPVYISFLIIILSIIITDNFVEAVFWGYILDLIYGNGHIFSYNYFYFFTTTIILIYMLSFKIKKMVRFSL